MFAIGIQLGVVVRVTIKPCILHLSKQEIEFLSIYDVYPIRRTGNG